MHLVKILAVAITSLIDPIDVAIYAIIGFLVSSYRAAAIAAFFAGVIVFALIYWISVAAANGVLHDSVDDAVGRTIAYVIGAFVILTARHLWKKRNLRGGLN